MKINLASLLKQYKYLLISLAAFIVLGGIAPFGSNKYIISSVFDFFLIYVALSESYDIMGGFMGYVNLGLTVYFAAGAYTFAILFYVLRYSSVEAFVGAVLFTALLGLLISFPMFRLKGFYFAVANLALLELGYYIVLAPALGRWTNGVGGINGVPGNYVDAYYAIFGFAVFTIVFVFMLSKSRFGLALTSIREDEEIAEASGINTRRVKRIAMMISAVLAGVTGCLFAWSQGTIVPSTVFSLYLAFIPVTFALFGGTGTVIGPIIGSAIYSFLDYVLRSPAIQNSSLAWVSLYEQAIVGIFLIIVGLFAPDGILGLSRRAYGRFRSRRTTAKEFEKEIDESAPRMPQ